MRWTCSSHTHAVYIALTLFFFYTQMAAFNPVLTGQPGFMGQGLSIFGEGADTTNYATMPPAAPPGLRGVTTGKGSTLAASRGTNAPVIANGRQRPMVGGAKRLRNIRDNELLFNRRLQVVNIQDDDGEDGFVAFTELQRWLMEHRGVRGFLNKRYVLDEFLLCGIAASAGEGNKMMRDHAATDLSYATSGVWRMPHYPPFDLLQGNYLFIVLKERNTKEGKTKAAIGPIGTVVGKPLTSEPAAAVLPAEEKQQREPNPAQAAAPAAAAPAAAPAAAALLVPGEPIPVGDRSDEEPVLYAGRDRQIMQWAIEFQTAQGQRNDKGITEDRYLSFEWKTGAYAQLSGVKDYIRIGRIHSSSKAGQFSHSDPLTHPPENGEDPVSMARVPRVEMALMIRRF
jgi:hypothetical protein